MRKVTTKFEPIGGKASRGQILQQLIQQHNYRKVVEVGTYAGATAGHLLQHCPEITLWCVDPYVAYTAYDADRMAKVYAQAQATVFLKYANVIHIKADSAIAVHQFKPGDVDIVFIDGNHEYDAVKSDLAHWYPLVASGGILCGHDYSSTNRVPIGVIPAVDEFCAEHAIDVLELSTDRVWIIRK